MFQFNKPFHCKLPFYTKCTAQVWAQTRVEPKLVVFLHPSGRLSSDSLSPEFRSLVLLYVHSDHFINDCAYCSIGFIILDISCECIFCIATEGHMVEQFYIS